MATDSTSAGGFIRSFAFSIIIICNLVFTVVFIFSIAFQVLQSKEKSANAVKANPSNKGVKNAVTLGKIQ